MRLDYSEKSKQVKSKKSLWVTLIIVVIVIISAVAIFNQPNSRSGSKPTDKGMSWLLANQDQLTLKEDLPNCIVDEDIPF